MDKKIGIIPEILLVILPSIILFLASMGMALQTGNGLGMVAARMMGVVDQIGAKKLLTVFCLFFGLIYAGYYVSYGKKDPIRFVKFSKVLKNILGFYAVVTVLNLILSFCVFNLFFTAPESVVCRCTLALDAVERFFCGGRLFAYPWIHFLSGTWLEKVILVTYRELTLFSTCAVILVMIKGGQNLRKMFLSYYLVYEISIVCWHIFPATSPDGLYLGQVFKNADLALKPFPASHMSAYFIQQIHFYHAVWIHDHFLNVSSIPSLHTSLCLILAYYAYRAYPKLGGGLFLWFLFTAVGTFYSLQHYFLDTVAGAFLAGSVFALVERGINSSTPRLGIFDFSDHLKLLRKQMKRPAL